MVIKSVPGQLTLFTVDDFNNSVASNFSEGISSSSTRSKAAVRPQSRISKEVLERVALTLTDLKPLS